MFNYVVGVLETEGCFWSEEGGEFLRVEGGFCDGGGAGVLEIDEDGGIDFGDGDEVGGGVFWVVRDGELCVCVLWWGDGADGGDWFV